MASTPLEPGRARVSIALVTNRRARLLAGSSFVLAVGLSAGAAVFLVRAWSIPTLPNEFGPKGYAIVFALVIGGVGTVVAVRQPSNPIGWIFCGLGVAWGIVAFSVEYARWALVLRSGRPPGGLAAAWLLEWLWIPLIGGLGVVAAIFPDGRPLSPRWGRAIKISTLAAAVPTVLLALIPRLTIFAGQDNPLGVGGNAIVNVAETSQVLLLPLMVLAAVGLVVRFRRSRGEERQQLKWLALSMIVLAVMITYYGVVVVALRASPGPENLDEYLAVLSFLAIPVSIAIGVLKYRLYDIDIVINKAVVYGGLAAFITIVYVAVVVGIGAAVGATSSAVLSATAAAIVALAFQPVRRRAQRLANRIVYGERATPYQVLADLGKRLAGEYAVDDVLHRVAATVAGGVGADHVVVWLHVGSELRPAGVWPAGAYAPTVLLHGDLVPKEPEGMRAFPVRHQGETLGAIGVRKPSSDPVTPADERLVGDLAGQAGLVLRNVRLIADLRASRQRLVAAQDEERRRIERNIHDGAQQELVALAVKIRLLEQLVERDPMEAKSIAVALQVDAGRAIDDLRELARGIYPPLLADKGLVAALESQARRFVVPVTLEGEGIGRYPREVEAAVYFSCLEALQNVASTCRHPESRSASLTATADSDSRWPTTVWASKRAHQPMAPGSKASPIGFRRLAEMCTSGQRREPARV